MRLVKVSVCARACLRNAGEKLMALAGARSPSGRRITLAEFLREAGLELEDVYRSGSWSGLQRDAGLSVPAPGPHEALIGDRLSGVLHVDDPLRLGAYERLAASASVSVLSDADRRLVTGFHFAVCPSRPHDQSIDHGETSRPSWRVLHEYERAA